MFDRHVIYTVHVDAYPFEFSERERKAFSCMDDSIVPRWRAYYVIKLCQDAGYPAENPFPHLRERTPRQPKAKRAWVEIVKV